MICKDLNKEIKLVSDSVNFSFHRRVPTSALVVCLLQAIHIKSNVHHSTTNPPALTPTATSV